MVTNTDRQRQGVSLVKLSCYNLARLKSNHADIWQTHGKRCSVKFILYLSVGLAREYC